MAIDSPNYSATTTKSNAGWPMTFAWFVCSLGAVFYCYEYFLRISPSVMTHELMKTYHLQEAGSLSAYFYHAYVPMQIAVGLLIDRFGPRLLLTLACLICAIGTFLFASGESLLVAKIGRFMVGFGSAFAFVGALKLATIWLPPNRFALISGIVLCLGMIGAMIGDILLERTVFFLGWQTTIYASAFVGVGLTFILWSVIRDNNPFNTYTHTQLVSFNNVLCGLWKALKNPQIWLNGLIGMLLYTSLSAFAEIWGIPYLSQAHQLTNEMAAKANSMVFLGWAIGGPIWGWFSDYIRLRRMPLLIGSLVALMTLCILLYTKHIPITGIYCLLFLYGFFSSAQILVFAVCHEISSLKVAGTAIALTNMIVMIGGNIFQPVIGRLLVGSWDGVTIDGVPHYSTANYTSALSTLPMCVLLGFVCAIFLRETYCNLKENHSR